MQTDPEMATVVEDVLDFARDDWVGLWVILNWVKARIPDASSDEWKAATLSVCAAVLERGSRRETTHTHQAAFEHGLTRPSRPW